MVSYSCVDIKFNSASSTMLPVGTDLGNAGKVEPALSWYIGIEECSLRIKHPPPPPASTRHSPKVCLMLVHRLRRWSNIESTLGLVFAGPLVEEAHD